jgi:hypothetical protein
VPYTSPAHCSRGGTHVYKRNAWQQNNCRSVLKEKSNTHCVNWRLHSHQYQGALFVCSGYNVLSVPSLCIKIGKHALTQLHAQSLKQQAHPYEPCLATCGNETVVRLWSPEVSGLKLVLHVSHILALISSLLASKIR